MFSPNPDSLKRDWEVLGSQRVKQVREEVHIIKEALERPEAGTTGRTHGRVF